jgi:hypothetical protein
MMFWQDDLSRAGKSPAVSYEISLISVSDCSGNFVGLAF